MKRACSSYLIAALLSVIPLTAPAAAKPVPPGQKPGIRFAEPVAYNSGGIFADSVAIADLKGDGILDLVVVSKYQNGNSAAGAVSVFLGNGDGTFQSAVTYGTGAYYASAVAVGDLRGDGIPDLVVANVCSSLNQNGSCAAPGAVSVLLGNGDGTFQPAVICSPSAPGAYSLAIADMRGDGIPDLIVADFGLVQYEGAVAVLLGNGDGTFQPGVNYNSGGEGSYSAAIGDFNGDGIPDIAVSNSCESTSCQSDGTAGVMLGNGDGTFQPVVTYDSGSPRTDWVAAGDLRGNGIVDLVVASGIGINAVGVLLGNGNGTFQAPVTYPLNGIVGGEVAIRDLNGDGIPDLAVTDGCIKLVRGACAGARVLVLLGNGDGTFQSPIVYSAGGYGASAIAIGDVNGDGRPDLVVADSWQSPGNSQGSVAVLLNETSYTTKTALAASPNPAHVKQPVTLTATITSTPPVPKGELVTFYNGKTAIGTGTTANGVANLATSFSKAKTYTIKASYPGDPFRKASSGTVKLVVNP